VTATPAPPQSQVADNTPTSTVIPALTHNGGTPARNQKGGGFLWPFTAAPIGALIALGIVLIVGLFYLLQYLSPSPTLPLRPGSAHLRGSVRDKSLDTVPAPDKEEETLTQQEFTPVRVKAVSKENVGADKPAPLDEEPSGEMHMPAFDDPHLVEHLQQEARMKAWQMRQNTAKMRKIRRK